MAYNQYPGSRYGSLYDQYPAPQGINPVDEIGPALDTTNPRPSLKRAANVNLAEAKAAAAPVAATTATTVPGSTSPELAGLAQSSEAPTTTTTTPAAVPATPATTPVAATPAVAATPTIPAYLQPLIEAIPGLMNPVTTPLTMDPAARQAMLNQATRTSQRGTDLAAESLRAKMGGATGGLVAPGESGLADTALGSIYRGGASDVAGIAGKLASEEAARYPELAMNQQNLNLSRMLAGGQLGGQVGGFDLSQQGLTYQQQQDALQMLMQMYGGEQGYQQAQWSPYYQGVVGAYGGA